MTLVYNIEPAHIDIIFKQGDTINISFDVYLNDVLFIMTGMQLDIKFRRKDGLLIKNFSSAGIAPAITIVTSSYNLYEIAGFSNIDVLDYDVQLIDGADVSTIQYGEAKIKKQIT
jgi:hypothetical protein